MIAISVALVAIATSAIPATTPDDLRGTITVHHGRADRTRVLLTDEHGQQHRLVGNPFQAELPRLGKMLVHVQGIQLKPNTIHVERIAILKAGKGERPLVGMIAKGPEDTLLFVDDLGIAHPVDPRSTRLLRGQVGARIWLINRPDDRTIRPKRFGILRGPSQNIKKR